MTLSRRQFIRNTSVAGGALTLGFSLSACSPVQLPKISAADFQPDSHLRITPDNQVIIQVHKYEMGQGVLTAFVTLIAEELELNPDDVNWEWAPVHSAFNDPESQLQITGGSASVRVFYDILRQVGASAREMLLSAAAQDSGKPRSELMAQQGVVSSSDGGYSATYGQLVATANTLVVPEDVPLKPASQFKLIGSFDARPDARSKADGTAQFAADVQVPNALTAVVIRCPLQGGSCDGWNADVAKALPGVEAIFQIDNGIAVVAKNYWRARKAADAVDVNWKSGSSVMQDSAAIEAALGAAFDSDDFKEVRAEGEVTANAADKIVEAEYFAPFLAHAAMEPLNAIVQQSGDTAQVWVGHQSPDIARSAAAAALGLERENVTVHNQFMGGGFGRRAVGDNVFEAAQIAGQLGRPVKLVWSREDDTQHDFYRPAMKSRFRVALSDAGEVQSYSHRLAGPSINQQLLPQMAAAILPAWIPHHVPDFVGSAIAGEDFSSVEGASDIPYRFSSLSVAYKNIETPLPLGYWRSVGHSHNGFVVESFVDEIAQATQQDPIEFRRKHLPQDSRHLAVLDKVAAMSNWGEPAPGRYQGVAVHESFKTVVAEVVEVSLHNGKPRVEKVYCAVDCGQVVNPDVIQQQIESSVIFGLTAALKGKITLKDGRIEQSNFHDYPLMRIDETPDIVVAILELDRHPSGVGEPATPPVAPALGNAIFAATGKRLRSLPLELG